MSTRLNERVVIKFLISDKVNGTVIHRRSQAIRNKEMVDQSTLCRWVAIFRVSKTDKIAIEDEAWSADQCLRQIRNIENK